MKKNIKVILGVVLIVLVILLIFYYFNHNQQKAVYSYSNDTFSYSSNRPMPDYVMNFKSHNGSYDVYTINFQSRNFTTYPTRIYGLVFMPVNKTNFGGVVYLPGGGVTKEQASWLSGIIAENGYAVIDIDQRGIGETGGYYLSIDQDYQIFAQGKEPIQHLSVYDALASYDVLSNISGINKSDIGFVGESMGGRYVVIAAAMEHRARGVIGISVSGFHVKKDNSYGNDFLVSIDPDHYIANISPNYLFLLQGDSDSVVNITNAEYTFILAQQPKQFFTASGCGHGYCDAMHDELVRDLREMLGK